MLALSRAEGPGGVREHVYLSDFIRKTLRRLLLRSEMEVLAGGNKRSGRWIRGGNERERKRHAMSCFGINASVGEKKKQKTKKSKTETAVIKAGRRSWVKPQRRLFFSLSLSLLLLSLGFSVNHTTNTQTYAKSVITVF